MHSKAEDFMEPVDVVVEIARNTEAVNKMNRRRIAGAILIATTDARRIE